MERLAVVGLGYVGIPLACKFADAGFDVLGIDIALGKVKKIRRAELPLTGNEPGLRELLQKVVRTGKLKVTTQISKCKDSDAIFICVETPLQLKQKVPNYTALRAALEDVGKYMRYGVMIIVESTLAPRTSNEIIIPLLEKISRKKVGKDFYFAHCPERVMSGKLLENIENCNRVIGAYDKKSAKIALNLYKKIVKGNLDVTDCTTAEIVKTVENTYRDIQIAFANEVGLICESLGVNAYKVRELVNKCPYRDLHIPGAGVGGHCIPKDPWLLYYGSKNKKNLKIIPSARAINDFMPYHLVNLVKNAFSERGLATKNSTVAVMGLSYLENAGDIRNSPAIPVINELHKLGMKIRIHDPYIKNYGNYKVFENINKVVENADCVIFVTAHREYKKLNLEWLKNKIRTPIIIDGRNVFEKEVCEKKGYIYRGIGK